jgi:hypothetical protein
MVLLWNLGGKWRLWIAMASIHETTGLRRPAVVG